MKRFIKIHLWLVLLLILFTALPIHAQVVFQFEQQGANTVVTGSGSGSSSFFLAPTARIGYTPTGASNAFRRAGLPLPTGWVTSVTDVDTTLLAPASSSLMMVPDLAVPTANIIGFRFSSGPMTLERFFFSADELLFAIPTYTASGTATWTDPGYTSLFSIYAPGTVLQIIPGVLHFVIMGNPASPAATGGGGSRQAQTIYIVDAGAMYSLTNSGLPMGLALRDVSRGAADTGLRGLNDRLKRSQSRGLGQETAMTKTTSSSLLRYLAFMQDENTSYKVALGLADAEERTVELNMVDTLSAQTGINFNGQSMGGGLPYAMMGVPLMPMAGGAATVHVVEAAPSGKTVIDDSKAVVESEPWKRWEIFAAGDFSAYDQDQLSDLMEGFDTDSYAGSVGVEYRAKEWLNLGLAWSYLESDTNVSGNLGDIDLDGNLISAYATAFWRQYWADLLYSYGSFDSDIKRNTGLGSTARGDTDSDSHNVRLNFGRNIQVGGNVVTGPIAGLRYSNGDVDPYSETGGGTAALDYDGTKFESMVSRVGWQATHGRKTGWGRIISQVHVAWEHEYMPENGTVAAGLQTSPFAAVTGGSVRRFGGFSSESEGGHPGTDWMSAGAGLRFELENGLAIRTDYEGSFFRNNAAQHYASAKVSYEW